MERANLEIKKSIMLKDVKKGTLCCPPKAKGMDPACAPDPAQGLPTPPKPPFTRVSPAWTRADRLGELRCRLGSYRMKYTVAPGLYAVGEPDEGSDVFVAANYKLSFDILRRALKGMNAWILVLDTKGINVWCAAGKGTFGTDELVRRMIDTRLCEAVSHRRIIVPQLGAPGVAAHTVEKKTGFRVYYGPVYAEDIRDYVRAGYRAAREMRGVRFTFFDRLILTPMEMNPAMRKYPLFALATLAVFGLRPTGIDFYEAFRSSAPFLFMGLTAILSGAFFTPVFINVIPIRSFAAKGWVFGLLTTFLVSGVAGVSVMSPFLKAFTYIFFPLASSYLTLQFTGSTVFTGISGVKKELRYAIPVYMIGAAASIVLLAVYKLSIWGAL